MSNLDIVRAWKDEDYRNSLTAEQRMMLPDNPAGLVELSDTEIAGVEGGTSAPCVTVSVLATCSGNCNTLFNGTCGVFSVGCC